MCLISEKQTAILDIMYPSIWYDIYDCIFESSHLILLQIEKNKLY